MENQRDPKVSRAAAKDAAERLKLLALLVKDDSVLNKVLSEADKTIRQHRHGLALAAPEFAVDDTSDTQGVFGYKSRVSAYKQ